MGKSKYPSKLDTSVELPAVRDNVLEAGSEAINSLRDAIIKIERTLGINPQGTAGNDVSSRLSKSLDGSGNIKKEALSHANVLSGPIIDTDVSKSAGIKEIKLKLDYPTRLLQSEISILGNQIDTLITKINDINAILTVHVHPKTKNAHKASSISVNTSITSVSSTAASLVDKDNVQSIIDDIYDSHINYDGSDISEENRSHTANQIYFDDADVNELVTADNAQDAIEGAINAAILSQINHQDLYHANGLKRVAKLYNTEDIASGTTIVESQSISFAENTLSTFPSFNIAFSTPIEESALIVDVGDIVTVSDTSNEEATFNGDYQIFEVSRDDNNNVDLVKVFGSVSDNSTSSTVGTVKKKLRRETSEGSLLVGIREDAVLTSASVIQISDPNAVCLISKNIRPSEITFSNKNFQIEVNSETTYEFDVYDSSKTRQTLDSIIRKFNEKAIEERIPLTAYRLNKESGGAELVISYHYADEPDFEHTLLISENGDSAADSLGFSHIKDKTVVSDYGSPFSIKGKDNTGLAKKLDTTELVFFSELRTVDTISSNFDFNTLGIRKGDILLISGAEEDADNGAYVIDSVTSGQLILNSGQLTNGFTGSNTESARFIIYNNTLNFEDLNFKEVSGSTSSALLSVFMDQNKNLYSTTVLEYSTTVNGSNGLFEIVDYKGNLKNETLTLSITQNVSGTGVDVSLDGGTSVRVLGKDSYIKVFSGSSNVELLILIDDADEIYDWIGANSDISTEIYTFKQFDRHSNLHIANVPYGSYIGRVVGGAEGTPSVRSSLERGGLGNIDVGDTAKEELLYQPLSELRSNGVVKNILISNVGVENDFFKFTLSSGIFYVGGKRFEYEGGSYVTDINTTVSDKMFIYADIDGTIKFEAALAPPECISPISDTDVVVLYSLEFSSSSVLSYDLRLFITDLDLKILNAIIVSNNPSMGHFTDLKKALDYADRFSQIFPSAGTPSIHLKSGVYSITVEHNYSSVTGTTFAGWSSGMFTKSGTIASDYYDALYDSGLLINFPVNITGEGDSSELKVRNKFYFSDGTEILEGAMVFVGSGFSRTTKNITISTNGFTTIKDLKFNQTKLEVLDYNIYDSGGDPQYYGVDIIGCVFDRTDTAGADLTSSNVSTGILIGEESDSTNDKGNVLVKDCKFLGANIRTGNFTLSYATRFNNIGIYGCHLYGESTDYFTLGSIFSLDSDDRPEETNIAFVGNQHFSNQSTLGSGNGPILIGGSAADRWGERFSRDVNVGGNTYVKGLIESEDLVRSPSYEYDEAKTYQQVYTFEKYNAFTYGANAALSGASVNASSLSGTTWAAIQIPTSDFAVIKIEPPDGATISNIILGVYRGATASTQYDWTIRIDTATLDPTGSATAYGPVTVTSADHDSSGLPAKATFSDIDLLADTENKLYYVRISHSFAGVAFVYWAKVEYEFTQIEEVLGV